MAASTKGEIIARLYSNLLANFGSGQADYAFSSGLRTLDPSSPSDRNMTCDTVLWVASVSKLMTAVAALSCVEHDLISLDEDVTSVLPELKDRGILEGIDSEGKPILRPRKNMVTLRYRACLQMRAHSTDISLSQTLVKPYQWYGI